MSILTMVKNIKKIHPNYLICYKEGNFYNCYGKDAYILAFLFDYKIRFIEENIPVVGFPKVAIAKVTAFLQRKKINYMLLDKRNNYNVDEEESYKNLNKYLEILEQASEGVKLKIRIEKISQTLLKELNKDKIQRVEKLLYESRKI